MHDAVQNGVMLKSPLRFTAFESQGIRYIVVWECTIKKMQKDKVTEAQATEEIIHRLTLI